MSNHIYKVIEIAGTSSVSIEDAIQGAIKKAAETIREMAWFEVVETRGYLKDNKVAYYQVVLKLGFTLEK